LEGYVLIVELERVNREELPGPADRSLLADEDEDSEGLREDTFEPESRDEDAPFFAESERTARCEELLILEGLIGEFESRAPSEA
jgi:hypothetical protein